MALIRLGRNSSMASRGPRAAPPAPRSPARCSAGRLSLPEPSGRPLPAALPPAHAPGSLRFLQAHHSDGVSSERFLPLSHPKTKPELHARAAFPSFAALVALAGLLCPLLFVCVCPPP